MVPNDRVSRVIGPLGETISRLQTASGCNVQISAGSLAVCFQHKKNAHIEFFAFRRRLRQPHAPSDADRLQRSD